MKTLVILCRCLLMSACASTPAATLNVSIRHTFGGSDLQYGQMSFTNATGNILSVTRLDYLLSGFVLVSSSGSETPLTNQFGYISAGEHREHFSLTNVPTNRYTRLRFRVGLIPEVNHADPAV